MSGEQTKLWYLSQINLFRELSEDMLQEIAEASQMRDFEGGRYIATPHDDTGERIYFLKKGEVEVYESTEDGKKIIIDILQPGDILGYTNIAQESPTEHKQFIRAHSPVTLCIMPRSDFLALLEKKPDLALKIIKQLSAKLSATESRLRHAALGNAETRVLKELERLWGQYGVTEDGVRKITRKFTHEELAQFIGMTRETVTRTLSQLAKKKKISIDTRGAVVLRQNSK